MKTKESFLIIIVSLIMMSHSSCNHDEKNILRKDLADIISEYITNHQNPKIVRLYVCHIGNTDFLDIVESWTYDKYLTDGFFFLDSVLVTYYCSDSINRDYMVNTKLLTKYVDTIPGYSNNRDAQFIEESEPIEFVIRNKKLMKKKEDSLYEFEEAVSNNVVTNKYLNERINDYINTNQSVLYNLKIVSRDGKTFAIIGFDQIYDKNTASGYFFRNGHLVVVYGTDHLNRDDIILKDSMMRIGSGVPNYKYSPCKTWNCPYPEKYEILNNGSLRLLGYEEGFL